MSDEHTPHFEALDVCHPGCPWCARKFFEWRKSWAFQMNRTLEDAGLSFSEAAQTSIRPPKQG